MTWAAPILAVLMMGQPTNLTAPTETQLWKAHLLEELVQRDREAAAEMTVDDLPLDARKVAYCESGWDNDAYPKRPDGTRASSASGYFQFLDGTWEWVTDLPAPASAYSLREQFDAFEALWDGGAGSRHWAPSRYCWEDAEPWGTYDR